MYIKLNIQGELLDLLQKESKEEFRSPTQQVMYIINKHYKDKINVINGNKSVEETLEVTKTHQEEQILIESNYYEVKSQNNELNVDKNIQYKQQIEEESYDYIDDDMADF